MKSYQEKLKDYCADLLTVAVQDIEPGAYGYVDSFTESSTSLRVVLNSGKEIILLSYDKSEHQIVDESSDNPEEWTKSLNGRIDTHVCAHMVDDSRFSKVMSSSPYLKFALWNLFQVDSLNHLISDLEMEVVGESVNGNFSKINYLSSDMLSVLVDKQSMSYIGVISIGNYTYSYKIAHV